VLNIRERRKEAGMSQAALAAKIGVSLRAISKIECGTMSPTLKMLTKFANHYGCTVGDLITEDAPNSPPPSQAL